MPGGKKKLHIAAGIASYVQCFFSGKRLKGCYPAPHGEGSLNLTVVIYFTRIFLPLWM